MEQFTGTYEQNERLERRLKNEDDRGGRVGWIWVCLTQGSHTQIYRGPHLEGKSLREPHFRVRRPLRAAMRKNTVIYSTQFDNLNTFCPSMIKISNFVCLKESRPAFRSFETPGIKSFFKSQIPYVFLKFVRREAR
jgi:hypothetical protein